jgi:predicted GIY-YIG superfamily endonuclease
VIDDSHLPAWFPAARRAANSLRATTHRARGADHYVYVVLLRDPRRLGRTGLYVGETSRDPDLRFDQHKTGYKASRFVNRFGLMLLPDLTAHLNPMRRWEAIDLEEALAEAFKAAGVPWVEGGH